MKKKHFLAFALAIILSYSFITLQQQTSTISIITTDDSIKSIQNVEKIVDDLMLKMTLDEKLSILGGTDEFFLKGIPRLGIPTLKMGDGPMGVRNWGSSTLYPATMLLAATWNKNIATEFGEALGKDSRARGMHISLAPGVNIYRSPLCGRNFEYMGEDPLLAGRLAVAAIKAVQAQGVAATVKHFAANNSEIRRSSISNDIDERTLREIYLPAFEAAVKDGNVQCIMNAYNLLNGKHCTANDWLNNKILKGEWGFKGVVMSDWHATHSTEETAIGGLDLEMPKADFFLPEKLKPLIETEKLPIAIIDDKVRRILRMIVANNWLDKEQQNKSIPLDDPKSAATALKIAEEGITLLKNENHLLPFDKNKVKSIVVLGPNATPIVSGLGSSRVVPFHSTGFLEGLQQIKGIKVNYIKWEEPYQFFADNNYEGKIKQEIYTSTKQNKLIATTETDKIGIEWNAKNPLLGITAKEQPLIRYTSNIKAPQTGNFQFVIRAKDMNVDVWIDEKKWWSSVRECKGSFVLPLKAGQQYKLVVETEQRKKNRSFQLEFGWGAATSIISDKNAAIVKNADAAVVCVGFNAITGEGEGADRTYQLPGRQEELILETAKLNPNTAVVLNAGGSVATANWIDKVTAMLHTFYPGQEGGIALAKILFGEVNPSGKLPFSYEKKWEDCAAYSNYPKVDDAKSTNTVYKEGIFIGYRWFDAKKIAPLFPFGYGLSYTTFKYSHIVVKKQGDEVEVNCRVTNTGNCEGAEVVQLYIGQKRCSVPRPLRELKDFTKTNLKVGESKTVSFVLNKRAFSFFHPEKKEWTVEKDDFSIEIGSSSQDIRLHQNINYK